MSFYLQGNEIIALLRRVVTIMIINYERDHNKTCRIESEIEIMFFNTYFFQYFIFRPSTVLSMGTLIIFSWRISFYSWKTLVHPSTTKSRP